MQQQNIKGKKIHTGTEPINLKGKIEKIIKKKYVK